MSEDWWQRAECRNTCPQVFFPHADPRRPPRKDPYAVAREVCARCAVVAECLTDALPYAGYGDDGYRGGKTPRQRAELAGYRPPRRVSAPIPHGTVAGYRAEERRKVAHCPACKAAVARYARERLHRNERERAAG